MSWCLGTDVPGIHPVQESSQCNTGTPTLQVSYLKMGHYPSSLHPRAHITGPDLDFGASRAHSCPSYFPPHPPANPYLFIGSLAPAPSPTQRLYNHHAWITVLIPFFKKILCSIQEVRRIMSKILLLLVNSQGLKGIKSPLFGTSKETTSR